MKKSTYQHATRILRIGNRAVRKAQEEIRRHRLPRVFSIRGRVFYELPDGAITTVNPMLPLPTGK